MTRFFAPPAHVDRLIVHQFDPARPSPGGIDSCLRGITRYLPDGVEVAIVGVHAGAAVPGRRIGQWEERSCEGGRRFWFLPVVELDPVDQARWVPHSLRLITALARHRHQLPSADLVQVHRMDSAWALMHLLHRPVAYFVHTQENGLTSKASDSFWRYGRGLHRRLEQTVVHTAKTVVVFNSDYSELVRTWNPRAVFSPTWFDPALISSFPGRDERKIVWVGRFEVPKDPRLALDAYGELVAQDPDGGWSLDMLGTGTLLNAIGRHVATLPREVRQGVRLLGRVSPADVGSSMARAGSFLMTSHPGYEGYPRVLVEAMASGLPAVVTAGSDTGGLVVNGRTGYVCGREPAELAVALRRAVGLEREQVRSSVAELDAPSLVRRIFALDAPSSQLTDAR